MNEPEYNQMYSKDSPYQFPKHTLLIKCGKNVNQCDVWTHTDCVSLTCDSFIVNRVAWRIRFDWNLVDGKLEKRANHPSIMRVDWPRRSYNQSLPSWKQHESITEAIRPHLQAWVDQNKATFADSTLRAKQRELLTAQKKIEKLQKELAEVEKEKSTLIDEITELGGIPATD